MRTETPRKERAVEIPLVRPGLLERVPGLVAAISTRIGGVSRAPYGMNLSFKVGDDPASVEENRKRLFDRLGISPARLAFQRQIHGTTIRVVTEPGVSPACDGLVTQRTNLFLVVSVADCVPVFLCDPSTRTVAAVHSGWKGAVAGVLPRALETLAGLGVRAENLLAFVGPSAGGCCYEVGEEVAGRFDPRFVERPPTGRPHLDLKKVAADVLIRAGVPETSVEISSLCTICRADLLHSYRRDGNQSGRMAGIIGLRDP